MFTFSEREINFLKTLQLIRRSCSRVTRAGAPGRDVLIPLANRAPLRQVAEISESFRSYFDINEDNTDSEISPAFSEIQMVVFWFSRGSIWLENK